MAGELIPELHDIGKLINNNAINADIPGLGLAHHYFTGQDQTEIIDWSRWGMATPQTLTWLGIIGHNERLIGKGTQVSTPPSKLTQIGLPMGRDEMAQLLLLVMADHLAASTFRVVQQIGENEESSHGVNRSVTILWRSSREEPEAPLPIVDRRGLEDLLRWLAASPDAAAFFQKFQPWLSTVPEEKIVPRAVTSLATHCMLVGKFFKVLLDSFMLNTKKTHLVYCGESFVNYRDIEDKCLFRLARCKVTFPQRPSRTSDLGIFLKLQEIMRDVEKDDHVLLHTLDTLWVFLPVEDVLPLRTALKNFLDVGFHIEAQVAEAPLQELSSNIFEKPKEKVSNYYLQPEMPREFPPKLCELCQMRQALPEPVRDEKSGIEESLCETCKAFRELAKGRFTKLGGQWEEMDIPVAWVRVSLDYNRLHETLRRLYKGYLERCRELKKIEIPNQEIQVLVDNLRNTALMVDFTEDYGKLLNSFYARLKAELGEANIEEIAGERPELLVVALIKEGQALRIADIFIEEFSRLFPECEKDSPISLSISISNAKYPFFEHWQYLDKPADTISIQVVGRARLRLPITRFRRLRELKPEKASSKLHRAVAVGARTGSDLMEKLEFLDGLQRYQELHRARIQEGFSVGQLLSYHKIAAIGGQP